MATKRFQLEALEERIAPSTLEIHSGVNAQVNPVSQTVPAQNVDAGVASAGTNSTTIGSSGVTVSEPIDVVVP